MAEKRKYPRIHVSTDVALTIEGKSKYFKLLDFSRGGLCFISERVLIDGTKLLLDIHLAENIQMVVLEGDFEWLNENQSLAGYKVRCKFVQDLDDNMSEAMQSFFMTS